MSVVQFRLNKAIIAIESIPIPGSVVANKANCRIDSGLPINRRYSRSFHPFDISTTRRPIWPYVCDSIRISIRQLLNIIRCSTSLSLYFGDIHNLFRHLVCEFKFSKRPLFHIWVSQQDRRTNFPAKYFLQCRTFKKSEIRVYRT